MVNVTQGPGGHSGSELRRRLADKGLTLPILGDDDETGSTAFAVFGVQPPFSNERV